MPAVEARTASLSVDGGGEVTPAREPDRPERGRAASALVGVFVALGIVAPGALALEFVHRFGVNVPAHDEWNFMPTVGAFYAGGDWWSMVVQHYGEHRIVLPRLVILFLSRVTGLDVKVEQYLSALLMTLSAVIAWKLLLRTGGPRWAIVPIGWLLVSTAEFENLLVGWQFQIPMANFFAMLTVWLLVDGRGWRLPAAAGCAICATFSFANGMLIWPAGLLSVLTLERTERRRGTVLWVGAGALAALAYRWGYRGFDRVPHGYLLEVLRKPGNATRMILALAGNNFGAGDVRRMVLSGVAVLVLSAGAVVLLWRLRGPRRQDVPWITLWLFSAGSVLAVAVGRSFAWQEMVTPSRYLAMAVFLPVSAIALLGRALSLLWYRGTTIRVAAALAAGLIALVAARQAWATVRVGWAVGPADRDMKLEAEGCLLAYRTAPADCLKHLYFPGGEVVRQRAAVLDRFHLGPFAEAHPPTSARGHAAAASPPSSSEAPPPSPPALSGSVDFAGMTGAGGVVHSGGLLVVEGWALSGDQESLAAVIVVVDGRWLGATARFLPRPDVDRFFARSLPPSGWHDELPSTGLAPGPHQVTALGLVAGASLPAPVPGGLTVTVEPNAR
jgi:hypothetical protein